MVMVSCTLPFMYITEAGLPPSYAGGGGRLTLMLMMLNMRLVTMMATDHGEPD